MGIFNFTSLLLIRGRITVTVVGMDKNKNGPTELKIHTKTNQKANSNERH